MTARTATVWSGDAPTVPRMVRVALWTPTGRPAHAAVSVGCDGVVPDVADKVSHDTLELADHERSGPFTETMETPCGVGQALPCRALKTICPGLTSRTESSSAAAEPSS